MIHTKWYEGENGIKDCLYIRTKVFIEEQKVSQEDEMDGTDADAVHLVVYENDEPLATGRLIEQDGKLMIGRVAVLKEHRGKKLGDLVVRMLIRKAFNNGVQKQYIHAQTRVKGFYEKLGFKAYGEEFDEAGIPHISMVHEGDVVGVC